MTSRLDAADLFCGAGGLTSGLEDACKAAGVKLSVVAVNHWEIAIKTHAANHPDARHYCASIDQLDPRKTTNRLDVLVAAPECVPAGTLILCARGLVPIECIQVGDLVQTHLGRWRSVTHTMCSVRDTIILKGHGHFGLETTSEHPFYCRTRKHYYPRENGKRRTIYRYAEPCWKPASEMTDACWATPMHYASLEIPSVGGRGVEFNESFWWLVGRWLGDGSLTLKPHKRQFEITISCGFHEADSLAKKLDFSPPHSRIAGHGEFRWRTHRVRTGVLFESAHKGLTLWLAEHFGKLAHGKKVPAWCLSMPREWRQSLLDGYMSADGCLFDNRKFTASSVSKSLALGIRLLASSLGNRVALHRHTASTISNLIEGRTANVRDQYEVVWFKELKRQQGYSDASHSWSRIRKIDPGRKDVPVYNLSVEEDESYVADGIVVHNCIFFSNARGGRPINDQRRASAFHVLRWMELFQPHSVLIENVKEFLNWAPLGADGRPLKSRKGETFEAFIGMMKSLGYKVDWRVLNCANYGDATTRERLFIIARRGHRKIRFPEPTHSEHAGRDLFRDLKPWVPARDILDWNLVGKSIYDRSRPLSPNTLRRIEAGLRKFGTRAFIIQQQSGGAARLVDLPLPTIASAGAQQLVQPFIVRVNGGNDPYSRTDSIDDPLTTLTAHPTHALIEPFLVTIAHSNNKPDARSIDRPLPTILTEVEQALVQPFLTTYHGDAGQPRVESIDDPLLRLRSGCIPTVDTGNHDAVIEPFIVSRRGNGKQLDSSARSIHRPLPTITTGTNLCVAQPFIIGYHKRGENVHSIDDPLPTLTTRDRFALVIPNVGEFELDIRMRMLEPHEEAAAHGVADYDWAGASKTDQKRMIGNMVPRRTAAALCQTILD